MSDQNERLPGEAGSLEPIERLLAEFTTVAPRIDRDRLMFAAGQAAARQADGTPATAKQAATISRAARPAIWQASTLALAATTLALAFTLWSRSVPQPVIVQHNPPVVVPARAAPPAEKQIDKPFDQQLAARPALPNREPMLAEATPNNYVRTREVALRMGLDAIGSPGGSGGPSSEARSFGQWLNELNRDLRTSATSESAEPMSAM